MSHAAHIVDAQFEEYTAARSGVVPALRVTRRQAFLETAPLLLNEVQELLSRPITESAQLGAELVTPLWALLRMAQDAGVGDFARIVQGLHVYATLLNSGALEVEAQDWSFFLATTDSLEAVLDTLRRDETATDFGAETGRAQLALLRVHPLIAGIVAKYPIP